MQPSFAYPPGGNPGRSEWRPERYTPKQEAVWQAINTAYYAVVEGRAESLRPTPSFQPNMAEFAQWKRKYIRASNEESTSRGFGIARAVREEDWPSNVWLWLFQRLLAARAPTPLRSGSPGHTEYTKTYDKLPWWVKRFSYHRSHPRPDF